MWLKLECARSPEDLEACLQDIRHMRLMLSLHEQEILADIENALDVESLRIFEDRFTAIHIAVRALQRHEADAIDKLYAARQQARGARPPSV